MLTKLQNHYRVLLIIFGIFVAGIGFEEMTKSIVLTDENDLISWSYDEIDLNMNLNYTIDLINSDNPPQKSEIEGMDLTCHLLLDNDTGYSDELLNYSNNRKMCEDLTNYYNYIDEEK